MIMVQMRHSYALFLAINVEFHKKNRQNGHLRVSKDVNWNRSTKWSLLTNVASYKDLSGIQETWPAGGNPKYMYVFFMKF